MSSPRDPTQFTRESAERIANVVRAAELSAPAARPLNFERVDFSRSRVFRVATYTGAWATGTLKTVAFKYQTATPNTATVLNLFFPVTNTAAGDRDCAIAKEGTSWFLVDVRFHRRTAVFAGASAVGTIFGTGSTSIVSTFGTGSTSIIQFSGSASSSVRSFATGVISAVLNTSACTISITAQTATVAIVSMAATQTAVSVSMAGTQTSVAVSMAGTQTIVLSLSTFTSSFLTLEV